jgi:membrane-associated phospholipid phosphatase
MLHQMTYPRSLPTFWAEEGFLERVRALYAHNLTPDMLAVSFKDYYVGFPSLHTALPIIGLWFLRPWKKLARPLVFCYVVLLVPSIVLLEWHFLMDIAGGVVTAFLSIWLVERFSGANAEEAALLANPTHRFEKSSLAPFPAELVEE